MSKTKYTPRPDHTGTERGIFAHNKALLRKTAQVCALCGLPLDKSLKYPDPMSISIDHIIPVALGGRSTLDNLQATHLICNKEKGTRLLADMTTENALDIQKNFNKKQKKCNNTLPQYLDWRIYEG